MLNELKRYNNIGDVNGITYFLNRIVSQEKLHTESLKKICELRNEIRLNFNAALSLVTYLGVVEEKAGCLYLTEIGKGLKEGRNIVEEFCKLCLKKTIADNLLDISAVHYNVLNNEYVIERSGFAVSFALFRNLLIQYRALIERSGNLVISSEYESLFVEFQKRNKVKKSLERLKKQLEEQERQGAQAEEFVMRYEEKRLEKHPRVSQIKQISVIDVSAGYDIVSFANEGSNVYDLFIEVKSYKGSPHFYWSQNEIEVSKLYEEKYCIYLIDVAQIDDPLYEPVIIRNPSKSILDSNHWIMNPTSYMVMPIE